jgi:hypothetical protein
MRMTVWVTLVIAASLLIGGSSYYFLSPHLQGHGRTGPYQHTELLPYRGPVPVHPQTPAARPAG